MRWWSHNWHEQWNVKADWCGECNETWSSGRQSYLLLKCSFLPALLHGIISQSTVLPTFTAVCISGRMQVGWYSGWCGQKFLVRYSVFHWFEVFEGLLVFSSELKHYVKKKGQASKCKPQSVAYKCTAVDRIELQRLCSPFFVLRCVSGVVFKSTVHLNVQDYKMWCCVIWQVPIFQRIAETRLPVTECHTTEDFILNITVWTSDLVLYISVPVVWYDLCLHSQIHVKIASRISFYVFRQQGNLLHFEDKLRNLCFIFNKMLFISLFYHFLFK
jgi:hypothetical protein